MVYNEDEIAVTAARTPEVSLDVDDDFKTKVTTVVLLCNSSTTDVPLVCFTKTTEIEAFANDDR